MNAPVSISEKDAVDCAGLTVTPVSTVLGAEISGLDLTQPLTPEIVAAIRAALLRHEDADPGPARGRGQDAAERSAGSGEGARISGPLPLDAERHRVLGQSRHAALRHSGLLAAGADRRARDDQGR